MREDGARDIHHAEDIDLELFPDFRPGCGFKQPQHTESGVVNQQVNLPEARDPLGNRLFDTPAVLHVQARDQHFLKGVQFRTGGGLAHRRDHPPTVRGEHLGSCLANSGRCSCN